MNHSKLTRGQQVYEYLFARRGEWVDGPEIANERVGGSEGHRRLRELRAKGHMIEERRHPNPDRDIWQYRLALPGPPLKPRLTFGVDQLPKGRRW